jgi:SnoaL-like domain
MWEGYRMPWVPELFSAPVLTRWLARRRRDRLVAVPYFDGLMAGELDALVESFAGEPELYHPVRGRIKGTRAFEAHVTETAGWLAERNVSVEEVEHVITERRGFEEVVLHFDGEAGRVDLPVAIVADRVSEGRIDELRLYFSSWPLTGCHATRPPLLQSDPELAESDVVAEYQRALATGDVEAIVAAFEPDGYAREPAGGRYVHRGPDGLRAFYAHLFSNDGGIPLEHCAVVDDGRACALEYNVVRWGKTELPPEAGVAVYARGQSGKLAAARIYDDTDPPLRPAA